MDGLNLGGFLFGNINDEGVLEEDNFFDEELRGALNSFGKSSREVGLNLDLTAVGIEKEDINSTKSTTLINIKMSETVCIDFSNIDEAVPDTERPTPSAITTNEPFIPDFEDKGTLKPAILKPVIISGRNGDLIRFTNFFAAKPAYGEGRYKIRRLRIKRKKNSSRPIMYMDDQSELFKKPAILYCGGGSEHRSNIYQKILSSLNSTGRKKQHSSLQNIEQVFNSRNQVKLSTLPNPKALEDTKSTPPISFHPIEISEWEERIVFDVPAPPIVSSLNPRLTPLYAGVLPVSPPASAPSSRSSSLQPGSRPTTPMTSMASLPSIAQVSNPFHRPSLPNSLPASRPMSPITMSSLAPKSLAGRILNLELLNGKWEEQIYFDDCSLPESLPPTNLQFNLNDSFLIMENVDVAGMTEKMIKTQKRLQKRSKKHRHGTTSDGRSMVLLKYEKPVVDRFNISNDKHYENVSKDASSGGGALNNLSQKNAGSRKMQISSRMNVQHSIPALKLSMPFYKTFWTKNELRSWHRPKIDISSLRNRQINFSEYPKTKEAAGRKSLMGLINNSKKLSLRNSESEFMLLEYSEEFPLLMMNVGMATFMFNYYRKLQIKDTKTPEVNFGTLRILEPNESSPFWIFGDVRPGEVVSAIQNNLFRAPLFNHSSSPQDFIALKYNLKGKSESKWFLKELPEKLFTVGQVFPTVEVFGPHSRKHNTFCRNRIQAFAYRLFRKYTRSNNSDNSPDDDSQPRLKIGRILAAFPQFSEGSLRKWLKDYADSVRCGHDSGTWKMRNDAPTLNEDDLRSLVTPEMICQYESMLAGQQRLNDSGFMDFTECESEMDEDNNSEAGEIRLAPWNLSCNFISATMGKCTLQLHGPGDPSGRGEAFSFVKAPLKLSAGTKSSNISESPNKPESAPAAMPSGSQSLTASNSNLSAQPPSQPPFSSSSSSASKLTSEQVAYRQEIVNIWNAQMKSLSGNGETEDPNKFSMFEDISADQKDRALDEEVESISSKSSVSRSSRKLIINRIIRDPKTGETREETEVIADSRLISAYISQRRVWERKRRRRQIAAAASAARAKKARPEEGSQPKPPSRSRSTGASTGVKSKKEVFVKCGTCGQVGHMRTNKICPRYAEYEAEVKRYEENRALDNQKGAGKISISRSLLENDSPAVPQIRIKLPVTNTSPSSQSLKVAKVKGVNMEAMDSSQKMAYFELIEKFNSILGELMQDPASWPFHRPVNRAEYPHYYKTITTPMDFGTIKNRIKKHHYLKSEDFKNDIKLVKDNCVSFNGKDHPFSTTISELYEKASKMLADPHILDLEKSISV